MKNQILTIVALFCILPSLSQELIYKPSGRVFDANNKKLAPSEVRQLLAQKPGMLNFYNAGRSRKTAGNILLFGGLSLLATDFFIAATTEVKYPTALTIISTASIIIAIPVKIGNGKKVKAMVEEYNKQLKTETSSNVEDINIISNQNGIGMRINF